MLTEGLNQQNNIRTNAQCKQTGLLWETASEAERGSELELDNSQQLMQC